MLASLSEKITQRGLSLDNVSTELRMGKGGRRDFVIDADCTTSVTLDPTNLQEVVSDLSSLKDSMHLDVMDVRVHRQKKAD